MLSSASSPSIDELEAELRQFRTPRGDAPSLTRRGTLKSVAIVPGQFPFTPIRSSGPSLPSACFGWSDGALRFDVVATGTDDASCQSTVNNVFTAFAAGFDASLVIVADAHSDPINTAHLLESVVTGWSPHIFDPTRYSTAAAANMIAVSAWCALSNSGTFIDLLAATETDSDIGRASHIHSGNLAYSSGVRSAASTAGGADIDDSFGTRPAASTAGGAASLAPFSAVSANFASSVGAPPSFPMPLLGPPAVSVSVATQEELRAVLASVLHSRSQLLSAGFPVIRSAASALSASASAAATSAYNASLRERQLQSRILSTASTPLASARVYASGATSAPITFIRLSRVSVDPLCATPSALSRHGGAHAVLSTLSIVVVPASPCQLQLAPAPVTATTVGSVREAAHHQPHRRPTSTRTTLPRAHVAPLLRSSTAAAAGSGVVLSLVTKPPSASSNTSTTSTSAAVPYRSLLASATHASSSSSAAAAAYDKQIRNAAVGSRSIASSSSFKPPFDHPHLPSAAWPGGPSPEVEVAAGPAAQDEVSAWPGGPSPYLRDLLSGRVVTIVIAIGTEADARPSLSSAAGAPAEVVGGSAPTSTRYSASTLSGTGGGDAVATLCHFIPGCCSCGTPGVASEVDVGGTRSQLYDKVEVGVPVRAVRGDVLLPPHLFAGAHAASNDNPGTAASGALDSEDAPAISSIGGTVVSDASLPIACIGSARRERSIRRWSSSGTFIRNSSSGSSGISSSDDDDSYPASCATASCVLRLLKRSRAFQRQRQRQEQHLTTISSASVLNSLGLPSAAPASTSFEALQTSNCEEPAWMLPIQRYAAVRLLGCSRSLRFAELQAARMRYVIPHTEVDTQQHHLPSVAGEYSPQVEADLLLHQQLVMGIDGAMQQQQHTAPADAVVVSVSKDDKLLASASFSSAAAASPSPSADISAADGIPRRIPTRLHEVEVRRPIVTGTMLRPLVPPLRPSQYEVEVSLRPLVPATAVRDDDVEPNAGAADTFTYAAASVAAAAVPASIDTTGYTASTSPAILAATPSSSNRLSATPPSTAALAATPVVAVTSTDTSTTMPVVAVSSLNSYIIPLTSISAAPPPSNVYAVSSTSTSAAPSEAHRGQSTSTSAVPLRHGRRKSSISAVVLEKRSTSTSAATTAPFAQRLPVRSSSHINSKHYPFNVLEEVAAPRAELSNRTPPTAHSGAPQGEFERSREAPRGDNNNRNELSGEAPRGGISSYAVRHALRRRGSYCSSASLWDSSATRLFRAAALTTAAASTSTITAASSSLVVAAPIPISPSAMAASSSAIPESSSAKAASTAALVEVVTAAELTPAVASPAGVTSAGVDSHSSSNIPARLSLPIPSLSPRVADAVQLSPPAIGAAVPSLSPTAAAAAADVTHSQSVNLVTPLMNPDTAVSSQSVAAETAEAKAAVAAYGVDAATSHSILASEVAVAKSGGAASAEVKLAAALEGEVEPSIHFETSTSAANSTHTAATVCVDAPITVTSAIEAAAAGTEYAPPPHPRASTTTTIDTAARAASATTAVAVLPTLAETHAQLESQKRPFAVVSAATQTDSTMPSLFTSSSTRAAQVHLVTNNFSSFRDAVRATLRPPKEQVEVRGGDSSYVSLGEVQLVNATVASEGEVQLVITAPTAISTTTTTTTATTASGGAASTPAPVVVASAATTASAPPSVNSTIGNSAGPTSLQLPLVSRILDVSASSSAPVSRVVDVSASSSVPASASLWNAYSALTLGDLNLSAVVASSPSSRTASVCSARASAATFDAVSAAATDSSSGVSAPAGCDSAAAAAAAVSLSYALSASSSSTTNAANSTSLYGSTASHDDDLAPATAAASGATSATPSTRAPRSGGKVATSARSSHRSARAPPQLQLRSGRPAPVRVAPQLQFQSGTAVRVASVDSAVARLQNRLLQLRSEVRAHSNSLEQQLEEARAGARTAPLLRRVAEKMRRQLAQREK